MSGHDCSDEESERKEAELLLQERRCFLKLPCLGSSNRAGFGSDWSKMMRSVEIQKQSLWFFRGFRAARQLRRWSEIRWKSCLRRLERRSKDAVAGCGCEGGGEERGRFRYDAHSYALNFDDGPVLKENFSVRYAVVPAAAAAQFGLNAEAVEL